MICIYLYGIYYIEYVYIYIVYVLDHAYIRYIYIGEYQGLEPMFTRVFTDFMLCRVYPLKLLLRNKAVLNS